MPGSFFYTIGIGFASGILFRSLFDFGLYEMCAILVIASACAGVWRQKSEGFLSYPRAPSLFLSETFTSPLFLSSIFLLACALGMFRMEMADTRTSVMRMHVGENMEFVGEVAREPEARANTTHLHIRPHIDGVPSAEYVLVTTDRYALDPSLAYGDMVQVRGTITLPEPFETDGGRTFNYPGYLRVKNIETTVPYAQVSRVSEGEPSFMRTLLEYKHCFMESLEMALPHPHAGLGEGILLGVKRALGEDLEEAFRKTGIIHIVVLSGYNVLIVVEAMMILLAYVCGLRMRMVLGLLWIGTFALLVGLSATVVRACIMASLLLIARATGRTYAVLRALMLAGAVMLLLNPHLLLYDTGFQLSFLATLGLILFMPYFEKRFTYIPRTFGLRDILSATVATQVIVLPILLYHTGMLSLVSMVVNALVLPVVPLAMLLTFLSGVGGMVSAMLGNMLGFLAYGTLNYIIKIAEWFASLSFSARVIDAFPFWIVLGAYGAIALWYVLWVKDDAEDGASPVTGNNDYDGWVIEEEKEERKKNEHEHKNENNPEALRASGSDKGPLPFR